jgi:AcrR family transcriptional regulator
MPRIRGASIEEHHEMVWADLAKALRELLAERDYDAITMGHIAARAGLARNTLYNYGREKTALVVALTERASRPTTVRVTEIAARVDEPAEQRLRAIIDVVLVAFTDRLLQLILRPGGALPDVAAPKGPDSPFHAVVVELVKVVQDGIARGEFREVDDVALTVELLSGLMRAAAERIGRDPDTLPATTRAATKIILGALTPGKA